MKEDAAQVGKSKWANPPKPSRQQSIRIGIGRIADYNVPWRDHRDDGRGEEENDGDKDNDDEGDRGTDGDGNQYDDSHDCDVEQNGGGGGGGGDGSSNEDDDSGGDDWCDKDDDGRGGDWCDEDDDERYAGCSSSNEKDTKRNGKTGQTGRNAQEDRPSASQGQEALASLRRAVVSWTENNEPVEKTRNLETASRLVATVALCDEVGDRHMDGYEIVRIIDQRDEQGMTVLQSAVLSQQYGLARLLVSDGGASAFAHTTGTECALEMAFMNATRHKMICSIAVFAQWLCVHLDERGMGERMRTVFNTRPMLRRLCELSLRRYFNRSTTAMGGVCLLVQIMLRYGADPNVRLAKSRTPRARRSWLPLHLTAKAGNAILSGTLLRSGSDPNVTSTVGARTPLHLACKSGDAGTVTLLLMRGARVDSALPNGLTALHLAASRGYEEIVFVLLSFHPLRHLRTSSRMSNPRMSSLTASELAALCGHHSIAVAIEQYKDSVD